MRQYSQYKHYRNTKEPGTVFFTTTVLDFVHVFADYRHRTEMAVSLLEEHTRLEVPLHAYVVMPHHVHFMSTVPPDRSGPWLMAVVKSQSAKRLLPLLTDKVERMFDQQRGLNRRRFWKASYRSVAVSDSAMFAQKMSYIHMNPARAGLCENAQDYRWSSASAHDSGLWRHELGLDLGAVLDSLRKMG